MNSRTTKAISVLVFLIILCGALLVSSKKNSQESVVTSETSTSKPSVESTENQSLQEKVSDAIPNTNVATTVSSTSLQTTHKQTNNKHMSEQENQMIVQKGDTIAVHYKGSLENGKVFDTSEGRTPFIFRIGAGQVIQGWDEGLIGMKVGEKKNLVIPADKAYGNRAIPGPDGSDLIPANSTLIFDVELLGIAPRQ
jgi:FKBP-type peptidyl-prolyl cis-trans isomerase